VRDINSLYECGSCGARYGERVRFCLTCETFDRVYPSRTRPLDGLWREPVVLSARELRAEGSRVEPVGCYGIKMPPASLVAMYGPPGGGKSTMACKLLDSMPGPVLYIPVEEGIRSGSVLERLERMEIHRADFMLGDLGLILNLGDTLGDERYAAICVDSLNVTKLRAEDLRALAETRGMRIVFVLQVRKDGKPAGEMSALHIADIVIEVASLRWRIVKSRYEATREGEV